MNAGDALHERVLKKDLLEFIGYRVTLSLDDGSRLVGRLASLSAAGNVILTDAERVIRKKRVRSGDDSVRTQRVCYGSVLFVRGSSVVSVSVRKDLVSDPHVIDNCVSRGQEDVTLRVIQVANMSPAAS